LLLISVRFAGGSSLKIAGRRNSIVLALLAFVVIAGAVPAQAQDLVDLTLTFEGAVRGEIAPCG